MSTFTFQSDVFIADLDVGRVICPENLPLPQIPQPFLTEAVQSLFHVGSFIKKTGLGVELLLFMHSA